MEDHELLECLIDHGADIDFQTPYGWTPLKKAISQGSVKTLKLLIGKGANFKAKDKVERTPL